MLTEHKGQAVCPSVPAGPGRLVRAGCESAVLSAHSVAMSEGIPGSPFGGDSPRADPVITRYSPHPRLEAPPYSEAGPNSL